MEPMTRVLQVKDCGSLLLQRSYAPYILGCLLPLDAIKRPYLVQTRLEASIQVKGKQEYLELNVFMEEGNSAHHYQFITNYATHPDFLDNLCQASALYLLTGINHPVETVTNDAPEARSNTLYQRVYEGGVAVEMTEAVRNQILLIKRFCQARATLRKETSVM